MPCLQRLAVDICTEDVGLVTGQNFIRILSSSVVEIHLFIIYYFTKSHIEVNTLLSTWPTHIQITCLLNELNEYAVIHTIPCDLSLVMIPAKIANCMLAVTFQSTQSIVLHLPQLKRLHVKGICEIFHLVQAAPNLECLRINFNCLNVVLEDKSTCELLQKRIVDLEINRFQEIDSIQLDVIARKFNHLRDFSLSLESPTVFVDSLILKVLSLWKDKNLRGLYIRGLLTDEMNKNLRQWFINQSHLRQEDSFVVEYRTNWISMWLQ
ncbi:unnamed protein product [Rotaria sp. Silwood2]|nr:unnamed protein product [Rotaria sp. Silwood2]CAF4156793.1 unnamed protein product [Rotaria sp. Silwood2]